MVFLRLTRSGSLHRRNPPTVGGAAAAAAPLLRSSSSLSVTATTTPDDTAVPKPRKTLSSIFSKPTPPAASPPQKPPPVRFPVNPKSRGLPPPPKQSRYRPMEERASPESLSPEAAMLLRRLEEEGYLKDANFSRAGGAPPERREVPDTLYSRHFVKTAAEKFGLHHQEIAKWLSGSDLKKVALFGCPSVERKTVFAAKRLRSFFRIQEDIICRGCKLKTSCKFMNQIVGGQDKVILSDVMRVVTLLSLNVIPRQLLVTDDLKLSVAKLLKEVINLSS